MESYKFEELLKTKLEERQIQPSAEAWQRVAAHKKPKRKPFAWMTIAAAVLIAIALFFMVPGEKAPIPQKVTFEEAPHIRQKAVLPEASLLPSDTEKVVVEHHEPIAVQDDRPLAEETAPENPVPAVSKEVQKVDEIIASLEKIQEEGNNASEATLDSLLENARRELAFEKQVNAPTNAQALLRETEAELDMSFKDRVFAAISRFKKIKIALGSDQP